MGYAGEQRPTELPFHGLGRCSKKICQMGIRCGFLLFLVNLSSSSPAPADTEDRQKEELLASVQFPRKYLMSLPSRSFSRPCQRTATAFPATRKANQHRTWGKIPGEQRGQAARARAGGTFRPGIPAPYSSASRFPRKNSSSSVWGGGWNLEPPLAVGLSCRRRESGDSALVTCAGRGASNPPLPRLPPPHRAGPRRAGVWRGRAWGRTRGAARRGSW